MIYEDIHGRTERLFYILGVINERGFNDLQHDELERLYDIFDSYGKIYGEGFVNILNNNDLGESDKIVAIKELYNEKKINDVLYK